MTCTLKKILQRRISLLESQKFICLKALIFGTEVPCHQTYGYCACVLFCWDAVIDFFPIGCYVVTCPHFKSICSWISDVTNQRLPKDLHRDRCRTAVVSEEGVEIFFLIFARFRSISIMDCLEKMSKDETEHLRNRHVGWDDDDDYYYF